VAPEVGADIHDVLRLLGIVPEFPIFKEQTLWRGQIRKFEFVWEGRAVSSDGNRKERGTNPLPRNQQNKREPQVKKHRRGIKGTTRAFLIRDGKSYLFG